MLPFSNQRGKTDEIDIAVAAAAVLRKTEKTNE
jgi:hypothetical protein